VSNLAHMADMAPEDELDGYVALFTDDARWEMPGSVRQGRDDILAGALDRRKNGIQGPGTNTRHLITTHAVRVDGDTATGNAYFMLVADTSRSGTAHSPRYTSGPQAGCRSDGGPKDPCRSAHSRRQEVMPVTPSDPTACRGSSAPDGQRRGRR
jgi:SnoaL-like domain